ncbi:MAG: hypothetical protein KAS65_06820 [Candidatus Aminicenantes bacterium]|nr:hypothetical protein [Candidatus Aminicenantes bacterium]
MNKYCLKVITLIAFVILIFMPGCKTTEVVKYTLTVNLGTGVTGNPFSGSYQKDQNEVVAYSYTLEAGYENLVVTLDGTVIASNGTFTVTGNHTLTVTADEVFDIRGNWNLTLYWTGFPSESWNITFSGGLNSGTYMDEYGHTGTYTVNSSSVEIDYTASHSMKLVGSFSSQTEMSGDITEAVGTGTWSATKL